MCNWRIMRGNFHCHIYEKNGLLTTIRIRQHLPLKSPFTYLIQIVIELNIRKNLSQLLKRPMCHLQIIHLLILFHWVTHQYKWKIEEVLTQNPVELQPVYFSAKKFDHLKQPLIDGLLSSFPWIVKEYHLHHKILI